MIDRSLIFEEKYMSNIIVITEEELAELESISIEDLEKQLFG